MTAPTDAPYKAVTPSATVPTAPQASASPLRGLLASPGVEGQPLKGVYFFAGEGNAISPFYTAHPSDARDLHWDTNDATRPFVLQRIAATHANTIVMSDWSIMPQWSPMTLTDESLHGVLYNAQDLPLVIMPALESGADPTSPSTPQWNFADDFPRDVHGVFAPGLLQRIDELVVLFAGRMGQWAQLYDRTGAPRYAIHLLHVSSNRVTTDSEVVAAFGVVASIVQAKYGIAIGFTLDTIPGGAYVPAPATAGPLFAQSLVVLAVQGYASEVWSDAAHFDTACLALPCPAVDFNGRVPEMLAWKRQALSDWIASGVPVILDTSSGFDGRFVWRGIGFWGDNYDYTFDGWRNGLSQLKGGGVVGATFNTWNGYSEGYAAAPTIEHGTTIYDWLSDFYDADPRVCSHMQYVNGVRTHRVSGAICEAWVASGGDTGPCGMPISEEEDASEGRRSRFAHGEVTWVGGVATVSCRP